MAKSSGGLKSYKYVAFLRGINVGGRHKVPMATLREVMADLGFTDITTLLNSGNVIFDAGENNITKLDKTISASLENSFGFPIPVMLVKADDIVRTIKLDPFKKIKITDKTRLYVSFLKNKPAIGLTFPWISKDKSFQILAVKEKVIFSVLDLAIANTPKGMESLEQLFGKEITTRNWNTIVKIAGIVGE